MAARRAGALVAEVGQILKCAQQLFSERATH
jgi:hypothetical protein